MCAGGPLQGDNLLCHGCLHRNRWCRQRSDVDPQRSVVDRQWSVVRPLCPSVDLQFAIARPRRCLCISIALSSIDKSHLHIDIEPYVIDNGALSANIGALSAGNAAMSVNDEALSVVRSSLRVDGGPMLVSNDPMSAGINAPSAASVA